MNTQPAFPAGPAVRMLVPLLRTICRLLFRTDIHGEVQRPDDGKLLIVANHESFLDGLLIGLYLPFRVTFVVHSDVLENRWFRWFLRLVPHLTVDHTSPLGIKKIIRLIEAGEPVMIFPEGRITSTASLMKIHEGPGFVAAKTGAAVLPVRIRGAAHSFFGRLTGAYPRKLLPKIHLHFLPLRRISMPDAASSQKRRKLTGEAMLRLMQESMAATEPATTLYATLLDAVRLHGRKSPLIEDMKQTHDRYGDVLKKSLALGRLIAKHTNEGETVGVLMPNVATTVSLVLGMSAVRRIPAMLNYTAGALGMGDACVAARVKTVITSHQFLAAADLVEVATAIPGVRLLYLEDLRSQFGLKDKLWLLLFALSFPRLAVKTGQPEDPALVLFTSGSEGKPKGVVLSHRALLSNVAQVRAVIDFSPLDKFFVALPLFHAFGFLAGVVLPVLSGTRLFLYPSPLHYRIIPEIIYDRGCTVVFGTSTFLGNYARFANPYDFRKVRYVVAGAEKLNEEVRKLWMEKFGLRILEGYGATECAPVLSVNTPMACRNGSVGRLLPLLQHRLIAIPGISRGGLLQVKGPNVMSGYYFHHSPGQLVPAAADNDLGWYDTGDIVDIDADGFVHIVGRVKRFAKIAGEMISLETAELIAHHASPRHQHAASTQTDAHRGETIVLFTTDPALDREHLHKAARMLHQPEMAVARRMIVVAELPLLGTGKTDYVKLKALAESAG